MSQELDLPRQGPGETTRAGGGTGRATLQKEPPIFAASAGNYGYVFYTMKP